MNKATKNQKAWLRKLEAAIQKRNISEIVSLYEENQEAPWTWDNVEEEVSDKYEELVNRGNNIIY